MCNYGKMCIFAATNKRFHHERIIKHTKNMKRKLLVNIALLAICVIRLNAQGIVIHQTDGNVYVFPSSKVESITTVTEENTYIFGTWYLGFYKNGSSVNHYDGTEYLTFAGTELYWGKSDGKIATYSLRFFPKNNYFMALGRNGTSGTLRWSITRQTDKMLILQDGTIYRYFYPTKEAAANAMMELDPPSHKETTNINTILKYATGKSNSTVTPMGKHFEGKHQTTDEDRTWLANASNEPDMVAGLTRWVAKTVKLYPYTNPVPADVNQHAIGDCCACAVFASMAYLFPSYIKEIIKDNKNNTYTVTMYDPQGNPVDVCVSNKILCDANGNIGQLTGKNNAVTWATIMEKAMMKYMTIYKTNGIEGIGTEHVAPLFTGCGDSFAFSPNSLYTSELKLAIEHCLAEGNICVGGFNVADIPCGVLKTVTGHAFTFMLSTKETSIFAMRNPWGVESVDGVLEIPDDRTTVQTIDARIVSPGAAAPFLRADLSPYTPPAFIRRPTDLGVSPRLLNRVFNETNKDELW